jgi:hypothetical protein
MDFSSRHPPRIVSWPTPTYVDWDDCPDTLRSTSGYCVFLGDNLASWFSQQHHTVSSSSVEVAYHVVTNAVAKASWLRQLPHELHRPPPSSTCPRIWFSIRGPSTSSSMYTLVQDRVALGHIQVLHVPLSHQFAYIFSKFLPSPLFLDFRSSLSI